MNRKRFFWIIFWVGASIVILKLISLGAKIGFQIGSAFVDKAAKERESQGVWQPVPLPPKHNASRFLDGEGPRIYLEVERDGILALEVGETTWTEVDTTKWEEEKPSYGSCGREIHLEIFKTPVPPGTPVDHMTCEYRQNPEAQGRAQYILLNNGGLWVYGQESGYASVGLGVFNLILVSAAGFMGAVAGLILSGVMVFVLRTLSSAILARSESKEH